MKNNLLANEQPPYWERVKQAYREKGMLYKFYKWLAKINKKEKKK